MGGEERLGAAVLVDEFDHGPGDGEAVVGGGAASDLVEQDERARGCGVEDGGGFRHLHHEGGTAARKIVRGSDAGEDAIDGGEAGAGGGHE